MSPRRSPALLLTLVALAWVARTLWIAGAFRDVAPHFDGQCRLVAGVTGAEDIAIHPTSGVAYVSACDRLAQARGEAAAGGLYSYALDAPGARPVNLTPNAGPDFCPHGIALWVDEQDGDRLLAIDHAGGRHAIHVYALAGGGLVHRRTLRDHQLVAPNDLTAVAADRFYVTNDHRFPEGPGRLLEEWLRLPLATVVYYDGKGFAPAASGVRMGNGIHASADGRSVYVAASLGRELRVYARDVESGALALRARVALGSVPDNVESDAAGGLWVAAHPRLLQLVQHRNGRAPYAPSQVLRLLPDGAGGFQVEEVYLERGEALSAASVAARRGDRLLIGAIYAEGFLDCRLPADWSGEGGSAEAGSGEG